MPPPIKLLTIVEATTVNAVAKTVLDFYRTARQLNHESPHFPSIQGTVVTFDRQRGDQNAPNEFMTAASDLGLSVEAIAERRRFDLNVIPALCDIVQRGNFDVLITNSVKSHFVMWRSRLWRKHPWVAFHHGYTDTDRKMRLYNRLDRWSLPHADRLVTVCRAFAHELADSTGVPIDKISIQHNSIRRPEVVSAAEVARLRSQIGIGDNDRVVLAVGRLSHEKAQIDLIDAFKLLRKANPDFLVKLIIVGDGPERSKLGAAAAPLGGGVIFTGQLSDVQPFYALADVFVLPSHSEGSPNVLLEAMAAKVPIVATSVGGVPEMIENNQSALLVPRGDPNALATAISKLLADKDISERLATNATTLVDERFNPESYVRSLVEIYSEVIRRRQL